MRHGGGLFSHRVKTAGMEGVAARDSPEGQPGPFADTIALDGINGVLRTGRVKSTTWRKQGRKKTLVDADQADKDLLHSDTI